MKRDKNRSKNLTQGIREVIASTSGNFSSTFIYQTSTSSTFPTPEECRKISAILSRVVKEGFIERVGNQNGVFRRVENEAPAIDIFNADTSELPIMLPLDLHDFYRPMSKNVILIAGAPDAGKTAFTLDFCRLNLNGNMKIRYMSSEMGAAELRDLISLFNGMPLDDWKGRVDFRERATGFQDLILPDGINVVDCLEISENFYQVSARLTEIFQKLNRGVALVCTQKDEKKDYGRGDSFGREKPRLYVTLDSNPPAGNVATIRKCKNWRDCRYNPNNRRCDFQIHKGVNIRALTRWEKIKK